MSDISLNNGCGMDLMTLTFLTNPLGRAKIELLNLHNSEDAKKKKELRNDIKFYRKRIFSVIKSLINNKDIPNEVSVGSINAWNVFARNIIEDFRVLDTHDSIQQELCDISQGMLSSITRVYSAKESEDIIERANKEIMATKTIPVTLDKYVIRNTSNQSYPWSSNSVKIEMPETKVDLTKAELRTKGVKSKDLITTNSASKLASKKKISKKENIPSEYEKINEENKKA